MEYLQIGVGRKTPSADEVGRSAGSPPDAAVIISLPYMVTNKLGNKGDTKIEV
jgi:hypothetical protein